MPRGPNGEKRPADAVGCAVAVAKIATGEVEEDVPSNKCNGGVVGGKARAAKLTAEQRSAIARRAAQVRWRRN